MNKLSLLLLLISSTIIYSCTEDAQYDPILVKKEVQQMFDAYVEEVNNKGIENIDRFFSDDERFYWVEDGILQYPDKAALIEGIQAFYPTVSSVDLQVSKSDVSPINNHFATLYVQYKQEVKLNSGFQFTLDGAMTILAQKEKGSWKFFQGHSSIKKPRGG